MCVGLEIEVPAVQVTSSLSFLSLPTFQSHPSLESQQIPESASTQALRQGGVCPRVTLAPLCLLRDRRQEGDKFRGRGLWGNRQRRQSLTSCPGLSPSAATCDSLPPSCCFPGYFWSHPLIPSAVLRWQCPGPVPPGPQKPAFLTGPSPAP